LRHLTRTSIRADLDRPAEGLAALPGVHDLQPHADQVSFTVDAEALPTALRILTEAGLRSLVSQPPTLEELFLRHYANAPADTGRPAA
jgi:ABC-2 type transport system ATP-binding protein